MNLQLAASCFVFAFVFSWTSRFLITEKYFGYLTTMGHWFLILHFNQSSSSSLDPCILSDTQPSKFMCRKQFYLSQVKGLTMGKTTNKIPICPQVTLYLQPKSYIVCVYFPFFPLNCPCWEVLSTRLLRALPNYSFTFSIFWPFITTIRERCHSFASHQLSGSLWSGEKSLWLGGGRKEGRR